MRGKEDAADYRYFPDPDLLPVIITDEMLAKYSKFQNFQMRKREICKRFWIKKYDASVYYSIFRNGKIFDEMMSEELVQKCFNLVNC